MNKKRGEKFWIERKKSQTSTYITPGGELIEISLVTTGGDHTSVEVIVGLIHTYWRDMQCSNNSVMDAAIICPEAVIIRRWFEI